MDHRVYDLTIGIDELPAAFERTESNYAYYRNQVSCYVFEPDEPDDDEPRYEIHIELHQHVNPAYDDAVRSLLGENLADIIQDHGTEAEILARDALISGRGDRSAELILGELLDDHLDEVMAIRILNRIQLNSTFL